MTFSVLIVDDNEMELLCLNSYLQDIENVAVIGRASNGNQAIKLAKQLKPDIIILDVEMPGINGIEAAREIRKTLSSVSIIFTTAHPDYAIKAFEVNSTDYLVKPYQLERLKESIQRVKDNIKLKLINLGNIKQALQDSGTLYVKQGRDVIFIDTDTIIFIEKINRKTYLHTTNGIYETRMTLDELEQKLNQNNFFRSSKSCVINLKMVERIKMSNMNSYDIIFHNTEKKAVLSRTKKELLSKFFKIIDQETVKNDG